MPPRPGAARSRRNSYTLRSRPALDARLDVVLDYLAELEGSSKPLSKTLVIDDVVKAGLVAMGYQRAVELALQNNVKDKEELPALARKLRPLMAALKRKLRMKQDSRRLATDGQLALEGSQMMAS